MRLPKPSEKARTRMPKALATMKCPDSCTKITTPSRKRKASGVVRKPNIVAPSLSRRDERRDDALGLAAAPAVPFERFVEVGDGSRPVRVEHAARDLDDGRKGDPPGEEGVHRDLVGGVPSCRRAFAGGERLACQSDGGEALAVERQELEGAEGRRIEAR